MLPHHRKVNRCLKCKVFTAAPTLMLVDKAAVSLVAVSGH